MAKPRLKMQDLCDLYQVTRYTVRRWYKAGLIPAPVRLNRSLRWDPDEIEAALKTAGPADAARCPETTAAGTVPRGTAEF